MGGGGVGQITALGGGPAGQIGEGGADSSNLIVAR